MAPTRIIHLPKILCLTFAMLWTPVALAANLIDSIYGLGAGSFELSGHSDPRFITLEDGSTLIPGWTVNTVNIDWVKQSVWNPSSGGYSIDMNGTPGGPGGIQTVVPTTIGTTYRVTFDIAGYNDETSSTNPKSIETTAGGDTLQFTLFSNDNYVHPLSLPLTVTWSSRSFDFVAISSSSVVSFRSLVPSDPSAMILDNVSIEAVPEPSAAVLVGITACSLVFRRRRR